MGNKLANVTLWSIKIEASKDNIQYKCIYKLCRKLHHKSVITKYPTTFIYILDVSPREEERREKNAVTSGQCVLHATPKGSAHKSLRTTSFTCDYDYLIDTIHLIFVHI